MDAASAEPAEAATATFCRTYMLQAAFSRGVLHSGKARMGFKGCKVHECLRLADKLTATKPLNETLNHMPACMHPSQQWGMENSLCVPIYICANEGPRQDLCRAIDQAKGCHKG